MTDQPLISDAIDAQPEERLFDHAGRQIGGEIDWSRLPYSGGNHGKS